MKLTSVHASGFRTLSGDYPLTGLDVFMGPTGAGKTSVLQAIQLSVGGYIPGIDKRLESIMEHAVGSLLEVGLSTDGFSFRRKIRRSERKGKVSFGSELLLTPSQGEKKDDEKEARIAAECGTMLAALDLATFTSLSANARRRYVLGLVGGALAQDQAREFLASRAVPPEIIDEAMTHWKDSDPDGSLASMAEWAQGRLSAANQHARDAEGAVEILRQQMEAADDGLPVRITEEENRLSDLTERRVSLEKDLSTAQEAHRQRIARQDAINNARNAIADLERELRAAQGIEAQQRRLEELRAKITHVSDPPDYAEEIAAAQAAVATAQKKVDALQNLHDNAAGAKDRAESIVGRIAGLETDGQLPLCVLSVQAQQITCPKDWTGDTARLVEVAQQSEARRSKAAPMLQAARYELDDAKAKLDAWETKRSYAQGVAREAERRNAEYQRQVTELEKTVAAQTAARERKQTELEGHRRTLEALEQAPVQADGNPFDITQRLGEIKAAIEGAKVKLTELRALSTAAASLAAAEAERDRAKDAATDARDLVTAIGPAGLGGLALQKGAGALATDVSEVLAEMGINRKALFPSTTDQGREVFELAWEVDGRPRRYETMSTGERLIYTVALLTAFLGRENPPVKMLLLDNIEVLDKWNLKRLSLACAKLVKAGRIDNVIAAGGLWVKEVGWAGWSVHDFSPSEAASA